MKVKRFNNFDFKTERSSMVNLIFDDGFECSATKTSIFKID